MSIGSSGISWFPCMGLLVLALLGGQIQAQEREADTLDRNYAEELPRIAPLEPEQALASFEIHSDFRIELVAAEPLVHDPIAMAFDERGRLFVVEMRGYSEERDRNIGAVRLLEDTNGDGVFDSSKIYVGELAWPTAVACYDGGIFVAVPPDILYFKDEDGDGVADTREVVYSGFGLTNVQGLLNSFKWGLDNRIHGATSSSGGEIVRSDTPDANPVSLRGRDFAFDPATRELIPESGGGQHGLSFDDFGRKFVSHNSDHIQLIMFEDRYAARNPFFAAPKARVSIAADGPSADVFRISPVEPWRIVRTRLRVKGLVPGPVEGGGTAAGYFTSATGVTIYKGDAWPADYRGNAFVGDVGSNLVHRKIVVEEGVSLVADRADQDTEFLRSRDIWFRPVQFCNGPDGNLYIADMYREVIEHPDSLHPIIKQHLDLTSGNDRGRIYRIVAKDGKQASIPDLGSRSTEDLVALLEHPNAWHRETAARLLYERQDASVKVKLEEFIDTSLSPVGRTHALYALHGLKALNDDVLDKSLRDTDPWVRVHALRLAEEYFAGSPSLSETALERAQDANINVRYQAAFTLGDLDGEEKAGALTQIARTDGNDLWVRIAIMTSTFEHAGPILTALLEDPGSMPKKAREQLMEHLAVQVGASGSTEEIAGVLAALTEGPQTGTTQRTVRDMIRGVRLAQRPAAIQRALSDSEVARAQIDALIASARKKAIELPGVSDERLAAIGDLAFDQFDYAAGFLYVLLDEAEREPSEIRLRALKTLARFEAEEIGRIVLIYWPTFTPELRTEAIEILFSRKAWLESLLQALQFGDFNPAHLESTRVYTLTHHADESIRLRAEEIFAASLSTSREDVVIAHQPVLALEGDRKRGRLLFQENCAQCHRADGMGFAVGPDLATMAQAGAEKILVNLLDPNREINPQYTYYTVETVDWESHSGLIDSESATSLTLKRAHGETSTILRTNIESITSSNLSLMPEGWEDGLDHQALADIIAFVSSLGK